MIDCLSCDDRCCLFCRCRGLSCVQGVKMIDDCFL